MTRSTRLLALVAILVLGLVATAGAEAEVVEEETRFFLANAGTDCGAGDSPFLTTAERTDDINCGYIGGGLPFGEVFHQTGAAASGRTFATRSSAGGVPFIADASREVEGVVSVRRGSQQGVALPGGGQVIADIAMRVRVGSTTTNLGVQELEVMATPGEERVELPFTFVLPEELQGAEVNLVSFDLNVRGVHLWHGFMELNGHTYLDVPTLVEPESAPEE